MEIVVKSLLSALFLMLTAGTVAIPLDYFPGSGSKEYHYLINKRILAHFKSYPKGDPPKFTKAEEQWIEHSIKNFDGWGKKLSKNTRSYSIEIEYRFNDGAPKPPTLSVGPSTMTKESIDIAKRLLSQWKISPENLPDLKSLHRAGWHSDPKQRTLSFYYSKCSDGDKWTEKYIRKTDLHRSSNTPCELKLTFLKSRITHGGVLAHNPDLHPKPSIFSGLTMDRLTFFGNSEQDRLELLAYDLRFFNKNAWSLIESYENKFGFIPDTVEYRTKDEFSIFYP